MKRARRSQAAFRPRGWNCNDLTLTGDNLRLAYPVERDPAAERLLKALELISDTLEEKPAS